MVLIELQMWAFKLSYDLAKASLRLPCSLYATNRVTLRTVDRIWAAENPPLNHERKSTHKKSLLGVDFGLAELLGHISSRMTSAMQVEGSYVHCNWLVWIWTTCRFQQDGATSHTVQKTSQLLQERYLDSIISRNAIQTGHWDRVILDHATFGCGGFWEVSRVLQPSNNKWWF